MKRVSVIIALSVLSLGVAHGITFQPPGSVTFKLNAITQITTLHAIGSKTNQTTAATSITTVSKATVSTVPFVSSNLLALLANSFNTNFPEGSQIGMRSGNLVVVDHSGTNVIFDPSPVLTTGFEQDLQAVLQSQTASQGQSGASLSGTVAETVISNLSINYDDTDQTTGDATHTTFQLKGLFMQKVSLNLKTRSVKITSEFQGTGGGQIRDVTTILTGTMTSNSTGLALSM